MDALPTPLPTSTVALIRRHNDGDKTALNELFERYYERVFRLVRIELHGNPVPGNEVADVVQDVFVRVTEKLARYREQSDAKWISWVATVARNRILRLRRDAAAKKRGGRTRMTPLHSPTGSSLHCAPSITGVVSRVVQAAESRRIDACVPLLPEDQRQVVLLHSYEGNDWAEVSERMQRSPKACQQLHARAKLNLVRLMLLRPPR